MFCLSSDENAVSPVKALSAAPQAVGAVLSIGLNLEVTCNRVMGKSLSHCPRGRLRNFQVSL